MSESVDQVCPKLFFLGEFSTDQADIFKVGITRYRYLLCQFSDYLFVLTVHFFTADNM